MWGGGSWGCAVARASAWRRCAAGHVPWVAQWPASACPAACPQDERKAAAVKFLEGIEVPRQDLYIPTNPDCRVLALIPESAAPMQVTARLPGRDMARRRRFPVASRGAPPLQAVGV